MGPRGKSQAPSSSREVDQAHQKHQHQSATPGPKFRSVDFLTPEQLRRKREGDRLSQKQARQRTKALIEHLQQQVQDLEARNGHLMQELSTTLALCRCRHEPRPPQTTQQCFFCGRTGGCDSGGSDDGASSGNNKKGAAVNLWRDDASLEGGGDSTSSLTRIRPDEDGNLEATLTQMLDGNFPGLDFTMWPGVPCFDDKASSFQPAPLFPVSYATTSTTTTTATATTSSLPQPPSPVADAHLVYHSLARGQRVWATLPPHLPATCLLDEVLVDLLQSRRPLEPTGGNAQEFQRRSFPSIQSLLNPAAAAEASRQDPVTSTIVNRIVRVMTVPTLPEQIAILYVMSSVVRWLISPTEANYDGMPEWLRPTPSQLVEPHPPWIDLFTWPKARERICRQARYHNQHARMSQICNETISINWPHHPADMILQVNGSAEYVLNPIFDRHIKNIDNWTVGRQILQVYPDLANEINIR